MSMCECKRYSYPVGRMTLLGESVETPITKRIFRIEWSGTCKPKKEEYRHLIFDYYWKLNVTKPKGE